MPEPPASAKPARAAPPDDGLNFDFVETPAPKPSSAPSPDVEMLDFVDEKSAVTPKEGRKESRRGPPPPMMSKGGEEAPKEETLSLGEGAEAPAASGDPRKAERERKKQERADKVAKDREARANRKALRGPGFLTGSLLPALRDGVVSFKQPRRAVAALAVLALVAVVVLGFRARRTPAGFFWVNRYLPSKKAATAAEAKVIEQGMARLGQGDFAGAREAVGAAAQLIGVLPDDEDVKAFFVLAASELKMEYGQVGGDWDQARRVVDKMKSNRLPQNRARGAFALASGEVPKGKQILAPLGEAPAADLESVWLYAQSLVLGGESARAAQVLDNALKTRAAATKLLLLRGLVARDKAQLPEAAEFFQKALNVSPENGRALVELAAVRLKQGETKTAAELLNKALETEIHKTLDAAEEARANMLKGTLAASAPDVKAAEAAFDRAVALDPNSMKIREAYGAFRLARREWEKASKQFESALAGGTGSAAAYAGAARSYLGLNRLLEADKQINLAVSKDGGNAYYIYLQGKVAEAIGKGDEAFKRYEAALQKKPDLVEALAAEGMIHLNRMEKPRAKEKLEAALKVPGADLTSLQDEVIGDLALEIGEKDRAREAYARALQKDPDDPMAHAGVGKALAAQGQLAAARKELELALSQVDTDANIYYEYGSLLRRQGESDAALEALRKAVKLDSKDPRYRSRLGAILVERGQFEEAELQLRQAVLMNDRYAEGLFFLARALAGRKNLSEAVDVMKKAVEIEPDNGEYLYHLGLVFQMGQRVQDAVESFTRAIDKNPKNADAYERLGLNLMFENRFPEAVTAFKKAVALDPKRARLWAEVGDAEQQSGDVDGAIRDFQRALAQDSTLTGVWTKLGIAYKDKDCKGCRTKAQDALKRAAHLDPSDATAHHELGYMYKDDNRRKEAIAEFRRYLELRPDAGDVSTVQDDIYYLQEESRRAP
jgi:tetratricopeptide (TPR) repeat protein